MKCLLSLAVAAAALLSAAAENAEWRVPLGNAARWGFTDPVAGDGKGGWTDQGPDADLRDLAEREIHYGPAGFSLIDEAAHPGAAVMVLSRPVRGGRDEAITLELPPNRARGLYLLHAAAWPPRHELGRIVVRYADGSSEEIEINTRDHCKDWRGSSCNLGNGRVAWQGGGFENPVLFASAFPLRQAGPVRLEFRLTAPDAIWLIPAVTLKEEFIPFPPLAPFVAAAGEGFLAFPYRWGTEAGSILDFSNLNDAPAGKYGFVRVAPDGHFTFENAPEKRVRFFGVNLVYHANFPDRETAVRIADELARTGCNLARLHLNDDLLIRAGAESSLEIDPAQLDRMEFLFAKLKERGVYLSIDLFACRRFRKGDGAALFAHAADKMAMKFVYLLDPAARENLKEFARRWLTHVNPHTGLAWKDDPALAFFNLVNEDPAESVYNRGPRRGKEFEELFREKTGREVSPKEFAGFLARLQQGVLDEMLSFVRGELRMKSLVTSLNMDNSPRLGVLRRPFDLVDNHQYHDHPAFTSTPTSNYALPLGFHQQSAIARMGFVPVFTAPNRLYGKPYVQTEYNFCYPNRFRAEGGPLMGAYAALQDWDGLVSYRWAEDLGEREIDGGLRASSFGVNCDPLMLESNRIVALLLRRGDVLPARNRYAIAIPDTIEAAAGVDYTRDQRLLALVSEVGSVFAPERSALPSAASPEAVAAVNALRSSGRAVSDTGEIELDSRRRIFRITAPRALTLTLPEGSARSGVLAVDKADSFQTVALFSMDGEPVAGSARLLLFHLSDILNSGDSFGDDTRTRLTAFGKPPLLLRRARCELSLDTGVRYRVRALSTAGRVKGEAEGRLENGKFLLGLDNFRFGGATAYELTRIDER